MWGSAQGEPSLQDPTFKAALSHTTGPGQTSVSGLARQRRRVGPRSLTGQISEHEDTSYLKDHNFWRDTWKQKEASDDVASRGSTNNICGLLTRARPFVAGWGCNVLHLLVTNFIENDSSSCCERRGVVMLKSQQ